MTLPPSLQRAKLDLLAAVGHLPAPRFEYQSETSNDRWIAECVFPGKRNGYFVEAGACDGKGGSSSYVLEKHLDWTGICVEPHDGFFSDLAFHRPNSVRVNACLAAARGSVAFIEGVGDRAAPYLSGMRDHLEHKAGGLAVVAGGRVTEKPALPLAEILAEHSAPAIIDYGAFDVEGAEFEVLEKFPFRRYSFRALSLECDGSIGRDIARLLGANGYREVMNPFNRDRPWERYWLHRTTRS